MPDSSENSLPFVERGGARFGKLSVTDRAVLLRKYKAAARLELIATLDSSGLPPEQQYAEKRAFDSDVWGARRWIDYINSFDGQEEVFRTALAKQNEDVDKVLAGLSLAPSESCELACNVSSVPYGAPVQAIPKMKHAGMIDGRPVYFAEDGADGPNPTMDEPARMKGYGS
jgi:hypothetical protein